MQASMNQQLQQATKRLDDGSAKLMSPPEFSTSDSARYGSIITGIPNEDVKTVVTTVDMKEQQPVADQPPTSPQSGAQYLVQWPYIADYFKEAEIESAEYVNVWLLADFERPGPGTSIRQPLGPRVEGAER